MNQKVRVFQLTLLVLLSAAVMRNSCAATLDKLAQGPHTAEVRGVVFAYYVKGSGPLLVVQSPGWGVASDEYQRGLAPLASHFTLVFYDTRGSGKTSRPADDKLSTAIEVDDLEGLRQVWGVDGISILGHSHGGSIALGYAIKYPTHVKKLILVGSNIDDIDEKVFTTQLQAELGKRKEDPRYQAAIMALESAPDTFASDHDLENYLERIGPLYLFDPKSNLSKLLDRALPSSWAMNKGVTFDGSVPINHLLGSVRARTLVIAGRGDFICGPVIAERIHKGVRGSTLLILDKTGHYPWLEGAAPQFFDAITAFLNK